MHIYIHIHVHIKHRGECKTSHVNDYEWSRPSNMLMTTTLQRTTVHCIATQHVAAHQNTRKNAKYNHVDLSANSALKAIASLTLSIVTIVSPPCLSSNLPAYLGFTVVKIMPISGCRGFRFVVWIHPLHAKHLPPRPSCVL